MMISTKICFTIAWIVSEAVMNALMVNHVSTVMMMIMMRSPTALAPSSVKLNAHLLNSEIPKTPTNARRIVAQTAYIALTPPPVPNVKMHFTLIPTEAPPKPYHARLAPQTVILALMPPTVRKTVQLVGPEQYVMNALLVVLMTAVHARSAPQAVILALLPTTVPKTVKLVSPVLHVMHVQLVL
jgi:hypothetical protein